MEETENRVDPQNEKHLNSVADAIQDTNSSLALYFRIKAKEVSSFSSGEGEEVKQLRELSSCIYCGSPLISGNFSTRLIPRLQPTQRISRLMQKNRENPSSLGRYQKKLVEDFKKSMNKMKITCFVCKKSWNLPVQASLDRLKQKREFEDLVKTRQEEEKKTVILDEETLNARREERRERKKELKRQKRQQKADKDWNAGLKIVKLKRDQRSDINLSGTSRVSSNEFGSAPTDSTEKIDSVQDDINNSVDRQKPTLKLENESKGRKTDYVQDLLEVTKKKQHFAANLKKMLAQEDSVSKKKDKANKKRKTALQAFLTQI